MPTNSERVSAGSLACLGGAALCVTVAELLFKRGATATAHLPAAQTLFGISVLASGWTWLGIISYVASFVGWLQALRRMPLYLAFGLMSVVQVLVPLTSWWLLGESLSLRRCGGILIVLAGLVVIARPAMQSEEKL
ncbi:MAG: hypothetical protein HY301_02635 [Verrucomicrobia bacterium]|nr:hypothetical protein [Verrucomicrobiota bacterium]